MLDSLKEAAMSKEFVEKIAKALVDEPDQVQVRETEADKRLIIELEVAKGDIGKVIGKKGRTAHAMRTLLQCKAAKDHKRAMLEIIDL